VINFRYHVVSLTAIFLALAIGLVVGTAAGNGPAADTLLGQVDGLRKQSQKYRDQVDELHEEVNKQEQWAADAAPMLLTNQLADRRVLLVTMPSAEDDIDGVVSMLTLAGAKIHSRVQMSDKFTDPKSNEQLLDLALSASPAGLRGTLPANSNGVQTSTALLAAVLAGGPVEGGRTVISAYQSQEYLTFTGDLGPADAIVVLTGQPYSEEDSAKRNAATLTMVDRLSGITKMVVGAPNAAGEGNVVRAVRGDPELAKSLSTVDNVTTTWGRLDVPLALIEQFAGRSGHYGVGSGASARLPRATGGAHSGGS